ncbi:MAG: electron transfer flavoprotein subunit alpha/FixB family protein [Myxococcota bacterium]|jgi:electron transfer flavoprotein alpha subunit|nr:electron transfer flavoprotein subunit alpha/FixB family protein [Myxococcota bacterium]
MSNVLILIEHAGGEPKKLSLNAITFGQQLSAQSGGSLNLLLVGENAGEAAQAVKGYGAEKVFVIDDPSMHNYLAESYATGLSAAAEACGATSIAGASSSLSKDLFPRLAIRLNAAMASDVLEVIGAKTFKRPMWAGDVLATVELKSERQICTVRTTEFDAPEAGSEASIETLPVNVDLDQLKTSLVDLKEIKSERPDATVADVVVSGGRGVKSSDGFKVVEELADLLNAGLGASRAVCDAGWVPNDLQIGQTGKIVAPDLYFALGISGAIQHVAGMKGSKVIVAINKDPEAPIFQVADYGLVADLFDAVPQIIESIKS